MRKFLFGWAHGYGARQTAGTLWVKVTETRDMLDLYQRSLLAGCQAEPDISKCMALAARFVFVHHD